MSVYWRGKSIANEHRLQNEIVLNNGRLSKFSTWSKTRTMLYEKLAKGSEKMWDSRLMKSRPTSVAWRHNKA